MTQAGRPLFELSLGEVSLRAPETPLYLELAAQVIETRRRELEDAVASWPRETEEGAPNGDATPADVAPSSAATPGDAVAPAPAASAVPGASAAAAPPTPEPPPQLVMGDGVQENAVVGRRARWFRDRFPRVHLEDGSARVMRSSEALQDLLRERGLQPHPRGDASMLLWQVRNRLGLAVDQVES